MRIILVLVVLFLFSVSINAETRFDLPEREGGHVAVIYSLPHDGDKIREEGQRVDFQWVNSNPEAPALDVIWADGEKYINQRGTRVSFRYTHYDLYHCHTIIRFKARTVFYDFDITIQKPEPVKVEILNP